MPAQEGWRLSEYSAKADIKDGFSKTSVMAWVSSQNSVGCWKSVRKTCDKAGGHLLLPPSRRALRTVRIPAGLAKDTSVGSRGRQLQLGRGRATWWKFSAKEATAPPSRGQRGWDLRLEEQGCLGRERWFSQRLPAPEGRRQRECKWWKVGGASSEPSMEKESEVNDG